MRMPLAAALLLLVHTAACGKKTDAPASPPSAADPGSARPAATPPPAAAAPDAAPAPAPSPSPDAAAAAAAPAADPETLCPKILDKIRDCQGDAGFAAALEAGTTGNDKKQIAKLIKGISKWPLNTCSSTPTFEIEGFLGHWDQLAAPAVLESCASLGAAVKAAGGLFGGDIAI